MEFHGVVHAKIPAVQADLAGMHYRTNHVLLVDDDPADVELAVHTLRNYQSSECIQIAEDGKEALDYLFGRGRFAGRETAARPRLILLDLKIPKLDGLEVLKAIRADARTRCIPVVILTSSKERKDVLEAYRLSANAFIQKPVDFDEFRTTVDRIGAFWLKTNQPPPAEAFANQGCPLS